MTDEEKRERQRKYQQASEQYNSAKRARSDCEDLKDDYNRDKLNLEKRLAVIVSEISELRNDTAQEILSANRKAQVANEDYGIAIHSDTTSSADISQSFHTSTDLDIEFSGLDAEKRRLETEIERIRTEISNLKKKIDEYSSQMTKYKRIMNQYD